MEGHVALLLLLLFIAFMKHQHVDITLLFMKCTFAILSKENRNNRKSTKKKKEKTQNPTGRC
jgi:hypothetical protein